jgi:hypothetical protein
MTLRVVLIALLVAATAAFVVGVSIERWQGENHVEPASAVESEAGREDSGETGEAAHAEASESAHADEGSAERFLGTDYEAVPFIVLAAAFSLVLAVAVWLRPGSRQLLVLVAIAMIGFAVLDVREVVHQLDEDTGGLALLAGVVAALHLGVAAVAFALVRRLADSARAVA